jgi:hypothetical protein
MPGRQRSARWLGALLGIAVASCGPKPVSVLTGLEIVVAAGDEQFGTVGQTLGTPLRAVVRMEVTQEPQEGVVVSWTVESGGATLLTSATATTDETGSVEASIRLGSVPADVTVRASIVNQSGSSTTFTLHTVDPPLLTAVSPTSVTAGDTVTLTGANFSPVAGQNVVLFSGMRGSVVEASDAQLRVLVPTCLPARDVEVSTQLGVIASGTQPLTVTGGGALTSLAVGELLDVADPAGLTCYALEGGAQYLALAYSASSVGAARHPFQLTALSSSGPLPAVVPPMLAAPRRAARPDVASDAQTRWDEKLRELEDTLVARERSRIRASRPALATGAGPAGVPAVGERRTFSVWVGANDYESVSAVAQFVGTQAAIFVDEASPAGGFTSADLEAFAQRFDDVIHPEVTTHFGDPSDLDGNERIIILFTPLVNSLTPRGSTGFIGGFFFGNDLLPDNTGSNRAEVFYSLVPDPTGLYSDARTKTTVLSVVPAVLAHEFQHMVQFNQRYIELDAGQEALWLSEALAQMAEELVARRYDELADPTSAEIFRSGARARVIRYLKAPEDVSLTVATGQGSLAERGAGFLHLLYLTDQEGTEVLGRLSTTTRRSVANIVAEVGREWPGILADWWEATYRDGPGLETGTRVYPGLDLRDYLGSPFPLVPEAIGPGSTSESGELWSSSVAYYLLDPDASGSLSVRLGGEAGGESGAQAALRLRIIRIS